MPKSDHASTNESSTPPDEPPRSTSEPTKKGDKSHIFWGPIIILIGLLALLDSLGVITIDLYSLWQLWPLIIIGIGISVLSLSGKVATFVTILVTLVTLAIIVLVATNGHDDKTVQSTSRDTPQTQTIKQNDSVKNSTVNVEAGATELTIETTTSSIASATLRSDYATLQKTDKISGDQSTTSFTLEGKRIFGLGGYSELDLKVHQDIPLNLDINSGAASIKGDLQAAHLKKLALDAGASSIDVKLGNKENRQEITVDAGASNVLFHIPRGSGVKVYADGGATSYDLEDVNKTNDQLYESTDFANATNRVTIRTDLGAAKFTIKRY